MTSHRAWTWVALAIEQLNLTTYRPAVMRLMDDADPLVSQAARTVLARWGTTER